MVSKLLYFPLSLSVCVRECVFVFVCVGVYAWVCVGGCVSVGVYVCVRVCVAVCVVRVYCSVGNGGRTTLGFDNRVPPL